MDACPRLWFLNPSLTILNLALIYVSLNGRIRFELHINIIHDFQSGLAMQRKVILSRFVDQENLDLK